MQGDGPAPAYQDGENSSLSAANLNTKILQHSRCPLLSVEKVLKNSKKIPSKKCFRFRTCVADKIDPFVTFSQMPIYLLHSALENHLPMTINIIRLIYVLSPVGFSSIRRCISTILSVQH